MSVITLTIIASMHERQRDERENAGVRARNRFHGVCGVCLSLPPASEKRGTLFSGKMQPRRM